jgi:CRP-like cAMP-binding protein
VGELVYARRTSLERSATVTAVEPTWTLALRAEDIDGFSESCRARFTEAFLSAMAEHISMLSGRLVSALQENRVSLV